MYHPLTPCSTRCPPLYRDELQILVYTGLLALVEEDYAAAEATFKKAPEFGQESTDSYIGKGSDSP